MSNETVNVQFPNGASCDMTLSQLHDYNGDSKKAQNISCRMNVAAIADKNYEILQCTAIKNRKPETIRVLVDSDVAHKLKDKNIVFSVKKEVITVYKINDTRVKDGRTSFPNFLYGTEFKNRKRISNMSVGYIDYTRNNFKLGQ